MCLGVFGWCLDGVWIRSESVWGCINTKSVGNNIVLDHDTQILPFILVPCITLKGLCLGVSGWGLSVSGDELIPNLLVEMYIGQDSSAFAFSSSALNN